MKDKTEFCLQLLYSQKGFAGVGQRGGDRELGGGGKSFHYIQKVDLLSTFFLFWLIKVVKWILMLLRSTDIKIFTEGMGYRSDRIRSTNFSVSCYFQDEETWLQTKTVAYNFAIRQI